MGAGERVISVACLACFLVPHHFGKTFLNAEHRSIEVFLQRGLQLHNVLLELEKPLANVRLPIGILVEESPPVQLVLLVQLLERRFKVALHEVKELLLLCSFQIVTDRVGEGKGTTCCYHKLSNVDKKLEVCQFISGVETVKLPYPPLDFFKLRLSELDRALVLEVPRRIMFEPLQLSFNCVCIDLFLRVIHSGLLLSFLHFLKRPAVVVRSIGLHAEPAESMLAIAAGHVHASLVLLDG